MVRDGGSLMEKSWNVSVDKSAKSNKLFEICNIHDFNVKKEEFKKLKNDEKGNYKGVEDYIENNGGPVLSNLNKNYKRLFEEVELRMDSDVISEILPVEILMQGNSIQDLLTSLENEKYIKEVYRKKKLKVESDLNTSEAIILTDCIRQGRILLQAGAQADMLAKPLIDFYAATAYAYAIIVINSPLHKSIATLKGSHGHTYNHANETIDFGGDNPSGTFMDLLCATPIAQVRNHNINLKYPLLKSIDLIQNNNIKLPLTALLSMVPELNSYYRQFDAQHKNVHKLNIDTGIVNNRITYNFYIGDGEVKPNVDKLKCCFKSENVEENQGSYKISISSENITQISPTIYQDLKGDVWYIESPIDGMVLPEICLHFLIISALCNIMRYSPHEWNNILTNKKSSKYSLLISKYIRLFEQKFPMIVAQYLTEYWPVLKFQY